MRVTSRACCLFVIASSVAAMFAGCPLPFDYSGQGAGASHTTDPSSPSLTAPVAVSYSEQGGTTGSVANNSTYTTGKTTTVTLSTATDNSVIFYTDDGSQITNFGTPKKINGSSGQITITQSTSLQTLDIHAVAIGPNMLPSPAVHAKVIVTGIILGVLSIVYNDGNPADTTLANAIKTLLAGNLASTSGVSGTMPSISVNLIGQSTVPTTYQSTYSVAGVVLVTPGCTVYTNVSQSQNLASQGKGVIAMGTGGCKFLDAINANWSAWGLTGQQPSTIGWLPSAVGSLASVRELGTQTPGPSTGAWTYPLSSTGIGGVDGTTVALFSTANSTVEQYNPSMTNPLGGALYAEDPTLNTYAPVVSQGRFLQFGFNAVPDLPATGEAFFVNLVSLMLKY